MNSTLKKVLLVVVLLLGASVCFYSISFYKETKYQVTYDKAFKSIQEVCVESESSSNKMLKIWHNSIYKVDDEETNEFTKNENGIFYTDFNDALGKYYESNEYLKYYEKAKSSLDDASLLIKKLNKPTDKFEKAFDALLDYYAHSKDFYNLAFNMQGSYNSCSEKYNQLENEYNDIFQKAMAYSSYY